ncbi:hypothetical protein LSAT2_022161 [Lamellibrachia satsuma]|nr:hypothetical protein LSAT2_022161 [Lamellibrachia satsuma]
MVSLIKNQLLKRLSVFTKNLSPDKLQLSTLKGEGNLSDLELDENVLMQVLDLPTWLRLTKAVCNKLSVRDSPKEEWTMFKRLFNNYAVITRLNRQEKPYQLAVLLNVMGLTGVRLYDNLTFTEQEDKEDTTLIIRKIDAAIQGEINENL